MKLEIGTVIPCISVQSKEFVAGWYDMSYRFRGNAFGVNWGDVSQVNEEANTKYILKYYELEITEIHQVNDGYREEKDQTGYIAVPVGDLNGTKYSFNYPHATNSNMCFEFYSETEKVSDFETCQGYPPVLHPCASVMRDIQDWLNNNCSKSEICEEAKVHFNRNIREMAQHLQAHGWDWSWESVFQDLNKKNLSFRGNGICHYRVFKKVDG